MPIQANILGPISEGSTASIAFTFTDSDGEAITTLDSCTFTYDDNALSATVINDRDGINALSHADFSFSAGVLTWRVQPEDAVANMAGNLITIVATFNNGQGPGEGVLKEEFLLKVRDLKRVS